jgi:hypothetical protein
MFAPIINHQRSHSALPRRLFRGDGVPFERAFPAVFQPTYVVRRIPLRAEVP